MTVPLGNGALALGKRRDVEAGDFDENELDNLGSNRRRPNMETEPYDLASDSEDDITIHGKTGGKEKAGG